MSLRSWLGSTKSNSRSTALHRHRLSVESLERRDVPTAVALPSGNVSWWTANSTAADAEGVNNATLTNVSYATGEVGQAWSMNGTNCWASLGNPSSLAFTSSFSIEGWIKVNGLPTNYNFGSIMFRGDDRGGLDPYQLVIQPTGNLQFGICNASNQGSGIAAPITTGQWVHVAATLDDATGLMTLYENGAVVAQATTNIRPFATLDPTQEPGVGIGNSNALDNYNVPFNGLIDELSVYNRALTSGEVQGIYKAGSDGKVISPVAIDAPSVVDGSGGATTPVNFTITRTGSLTGTQTVNWTTADDTAIAGINYVAASGTVTFADGQATQTVQVTTLDDNNPNPNLDFKLIVTPTGGTSVMGVATIINDDVGISVNNATVTKGNLVYGSLGTLVDQPGNGGLNTSTGMVFGPDGNLYVGSYNTNEVLRYNATTGAFMGAFVTAGSGGLNGPAIEGLAFRGDGKLYVGSRNTGSVLRYDATTGAYLDTFVTPNSGGLSSVRGMTFGPDGNLYISSGDTNQVFKYNGTTGAFLSVFVPAGSGGLSNPRSLTFGPDGNLYVSSAASSSVLRYNGTTGAFLNTFVSSGSGGLKNPADLLFSNGSLYVASQGSNQVLRYDAVTGSFIEATVAANSNRVTNPTGLVLDASNNLLVGSNLEIQRFGPASQAAFTVSLITSSTSTVTVNYSTADGTALAGTDYVATTGTLTFLPGETTKTIVVPTLNPSGAGADKTFTVNLSNLSSGAILTGQGLGTIHESNPTKFYVVDLNHATYKYQSTGNQQAPYLLGQANQHSRGIAANAAGTEEWVVDLNNTVYEYSSSGTLLGSWAVTGLPTSASLSGVTTDGTNIWLLDATTNSVFYYAGAASRLSGSQTASSIGSGSFKLNKSNNYPGNLVTDGKSIWVVDLSKIFKYSLTGSLQGSWKIDPTDIDPTGITINPNNVSDIWTVDGTTKKVYQYVGAATRTSGSQNAAATFALAAGDTNPMGIADPPPETSVDSVPATVSNPVTDRPVSLANSGIPNGSNSVMGPSVRIANLSTSTASIVSINEVPSPVTPAHTDNKTVTITPGTAAQPSATLSVMGLFNDRMTTTTGNTSSAVNEGMSVSLDGPQLGGTVLPNASFEGMSTMAVSIQWSWNDSTEGNSSLEQDNPLLASTRAWGFKLK